MREEFLNIPIIKNEEKSRFELEVDGYTAFIDYKERNQKIWLIHTESPSELAGKGVGTALVEKTLVYLKENNYRLIPLCPFIFAYIKRHLEWKEIVDESFLDKFNSPTA